MAIESNISELAANASADAVCALLDDGYLEIYSRGGSLLAEARLGTRAFGTARSGVAVANAIGTAAVESPGIAGSFKAKTKNRDFVFGGSVGTKNADMVLDETKLFRGDELTITDLKYKQRVA